jgi:hypothetical protein
VGPPEFVSGRFAGGKAGTTDCVLDAIRKFSLPARILPTCLHGQNPKNRDPGASSIMAVPAVDSAGAASYGRRREHEGVPTIANHSAQEFGAQLPCRPQYPRIRTDGKRTAHRVRVVYRGSVLAGMESGRIGRGRETGPSALADAFFIALAGGVSEANGCARCLAGAARVDMQAAARDDHDEAASEVLDYMVHSGLLWRLRPDGG